MLTYGDYPELADRCLKSLAALTDPFPGEIEWRIGMNAASEKTQRLIAEIFEYETKQGRKILLYKSTINRGKYPMMRWMFHDPINPITAPLIMWMDDDSYLTTPDLSWLHGLESQMSDADMCGCVMRCNLEGNQHLWIKVQPWYNGKEPEAIMLTGRALTKSTAVSNRPKQHCVQRFAVGGWWTAKTKMINRLDWPPTNIIHRGGDMMLGEAMRQHDFILRDFSQGVGINASDKGENHKAPRRGMDPEVCGRGYRAPLSVVIHEACKDIDPKLLDYPNL